MESDFLRSSFSDIYRRWFENRNLNWGGSWSILSINFKLCRSLRDSIKKLSAKSEGNLPDISEDIQFQASQPNLIIPPKLRYFEDLVWSGKNPFETNHMLNWLQTLYGSMSCQTTSNYIIRRNLLSYLTKKSTLTFQIWKNMDSFTTVECEIFKKGP